MTRLMAVFNRYPLLVDILLIAVLGVVFMLPRAGALGTFVTADEPLWAKRAANFYFALSEENYLDTYQTGHPGVPTMWAGAAAYALLFPEYREVGRTDLGDTKLLWLFKLHGPVPIEVIALARLFVAILCVTSVTLSFPFARRLFGTWPALGMYLMIAFDPFHVGHSRYLHTNGLLASFMFLAVMAFIYALRSGRVFPLVVSGIAAGLSFISITPGLMLLPVIALLALFIGREGEPDPPWKRPLATVRRYFFPLLSWGLLAMLTIALVWPAMWVKPLETLTRTVAYGLSAAEGEIGTAQFVEAYQTAYDPGEKYLYFYPLTYLWRTTPLALFGLALALPWLRRRESPFFEERARDNLAPLLLYALAYTALMSLGSKKFDRYLLPAFLPLDMIAAAGWIWAAGWLASRFERLRAALVPLATLGVVLALQAAGTLRTYPYYNTYFNPLLGGLRAAPKVVSVGWGEGLNEAALYLREAPGIRDAQIATWYTLAFNWYAAGMNFQAVPIDVNTQIPLGQYLSYDYALVYINQRQRHYPPELMDYLDQQVPEHTVEIDGVPFVQIYKLPGIAYNP